MAYASTQDMVDRFGSEELCQLTDRVNGTTLNPAVLARAMDDADSTINGYLAARYQVPVQQVPPLLVRLACDIARYQLFADQANDAVRDRYSDAVRELKNLATGITTLLGATALQSPESTASTQVRVRSPERQFGGASLKGY